MRRQVLILVLAGWCVAWRGGEPTKPVYLDCFPDKVMVYPGEKAVSWEELQRPGNAVEQLVADVEAHKTERYLVVLARPNSVKFYRAARRLASQHSVDIGCEAVDDSNVGQWKAQTGQLIVGKGKQVATAEVYRGTMNRWPVFFECRDNQVFPVEKDALDTQIEQLLKTLSGKNLDQQGFVKAVSDRDLSNKHYKVIPSFLWAGILALEPRPGAKGNDLTTLRGADSEFQKALGALKKTDQRVVFFVHDNAFAVFHAARQEARRAGLETTWELLDKDEPLKFRNTQVFE